MYVFCLCVCISWCLFHTITSTIWRQVLHLALTHGRINESGEVEQSLEYIDGSFGVYSPLILL